METQNLNQNAKRIADLGLQFDCSDIGNMERFITKHRRHLRYVSDRNCWAHWNKSFWSFGAKETAYELALQTIKSIYDEITACSVEAGAAELRQWARASRSKAKVSNILSMASQHPDMVCKSQDFDRHPYLLNCQNGVLNLKSGELGFHSADLMLTQITNVKYDQSKKAPRFMKFINDIFCEDKELIEWMKRALGYSLTGDCSEQCLFIAYGTGANGKSTLFETLKDILGSYAVSSEFDTFLAKDKANVRAMEGIGKLQGKRFASASETDSSKRFSEALVKRITGEDTIVGAELYGSSYEFKPTHKLWLLANHLPSATDASIGFWRRMKVIPFDRTFSSEEMDRGLSAMLSSEAEGILAWLVDGAFEWHKMKKDGKGGTGLGACTAIDQTTDIYQYESDVFGLFLSQVITHKVGARTTAKDLFRAYLHWCDIERNETPCSQKIFGGRLDERGLKKGRKNSGVYYKDVMLEDDFKDIQIDI